MPNEAGTQYRICIRNCNQLHHTHTQAHAHSTKESNNRWTSIQQPAIQHPTQRVRARTQTIPAPLPAPGPIQPSKRNLPHELSEAGTLKHTPTNPQIPLNCNRDEEPEIEIGVELENPQSQNKVEDQQPEQEQKQEQDQKTSEEINERSTQLTAPAATQRSIGKAPRTDTTRLGRSSSSSNYSDDCKQEVAWLHLNWRQCHYHQSHSNSNININIPINSNSNCNCNNQRSSCSM
ncbi:uncharacterized protein LOC117892681 [Drosophila subobscura]|uniref:uncharacterized protein LOC117892681 n=1 Tax=Drosophila subobscura TaxID=7241 RepID=UPI00155A76A3|nr:uncharacterized protein LOC117892681 [Drosophila subobscura]